MITNHSELLCRIAHVFIIVLSENLFCKDCMTERSYKKILYAMGLCRYRLYILFNIPKAHQEFRNAFSQRYMVDPCTVDCINLISSHSQAEPHNQSTKFNGKKKGSRLHMYKRKQYNLPHKNIAVNVCRINTVYQLNSYQHKNFVRQENTNSARIAMHYRMLTTGLTGTTSYHTQFISTNSDHYGFI